MLAYHQSLVRSSLSLALTLTSGLSAVLTFATFFVCAAAVTAAFSVQCADSRKNWQGVLYRTFLALPQLCIMCGVNLNEICPTYVEHLSCVLDARGLPGLFSCRFPSYMRPEALQRLRYTQASNFIFPPGFTHHSEDPSTDRASCWNSGDGRLLSK